MTNAPNKKRRPLVVYIASFMLVLTALLPLLVAISGLFILLSSRTVPYYPWWFSACYGILLLLAGLWGSFYILWQKKQFYSLKRSGYDFVRRASLVIMPWVWLATGFGKWLKTKQVRDAFGIHDESH
ncbi:MAG: hypothetical protein L0Y55_10210 [Anaerolineales bacterium]|nr:hypothetical protein [Anaerolineales bacterium]